MNHIREMKRILIFFVLLGFIGGLSLQALGANTGIKGGMSVSGLFSKTCDFRSIAACVIKNETIVWEKAYGLADIENNIEATTGTIYLLASVSKSVDGLAIRGGYLEPARTLNFIRKTVWGSLCLPTST